MLISSADLVRRSGAMVPFPAAQHSPVSKSASAPHVVALIGGRDAALAAADVGIGIGIARIPAAGAPTCWLGTPARRALLLVPRARPGRRAPGRAARRGGLRAALARRCSVHRARRRPGRRRRARGRTSAYAPWGPGRPWRWLAARRRSRVDWTPWYAMSPRVADTLNSPAPDCRGRIGAVDSVCSRLFNLVAIRNRNEA
ncbi:hypothetical protein HBB16_04515 [Pseudonocardia sp. MCCB 268]|nr:hypothetical protein [Pseudonocardia cytotoxica]